MKAYMRVSRFKEYIMLNDIPLSNVEDIVNQALLYRIPIDHSFTGIHGLVRCYTDVREKRVQGRACCRFASPILIVAGEVPAL